MQGDAESLRRFEELLVTLVGLAHQGRTRRNGMPDLLQSAPVADEFSDVLRFAKPPLAVQRVLLVCASNGLPERSDQDLSRMGKSVPRRRGARDNGTRAARHCSNRSGAVRRARSGKQQDDQDDEQDPAKPNPGRSVRSPAVSKGTQKDEHEQHHQHDLDEAHGILCSQTRSHRILLRLVHRECAGPVRLRAGDRPSSAHLRAR